MTCTFFPFPFVSLVIPFSSTQNITFIAHSPKPVDFTALIKAIYSKTVEFDNWSIGQISIPSFSFLVSSLSVKLDGMSQATTTFWTHKGLKVLLFKNFDWLKTASSLFTKSKRNPFRSEKSLKTLYLSFRVPSTILTFWCLRLFSILVTLYLIRVFYIYSAPEKKAKAKTLWTCLHSFLDTYLCAFK